MNPTDQNPGMSLQENDNIVIPQSSLGYFTKDECHRIRELSKSYPARSGVAGAQEQVVELRKSTIKVIMPGQDSAWIFEKLQRFIVGANQFYNFELAGFNEGLQVAEYSGGGHYGWHMDIGQRRMSTRKLSISVQLSEDSEYQGGDLEFQSLEAPNVPREIGATIVFPSYFIHRVSPVTEGTRWSLVTWIHGPPFS